ncbi:hypothetical protein HID58_003225 [Brassica napus]|uniref:Uncharacterized protein n=1 Tax=Brassica napus TaxID=3708 RepID=A0ABQ8EPJ0_BRANA|nr:hypothetical protein HID58_003225 [Brassica napus]
MACSSFPSPELMEIIVVQTIFHLLPYSSKRYKRWISTIKRLSAPLPPLKFACSVSKRPGNKYDVDVFCSTFNCGFSPSSQRIVAGRVESKRKSYVVQFFSNMFHKYAGETLDTLKRAIYVRDTTAKSMFEAISEFVTQISITTAGTGITKRFTVICSLASSRVPFCTNKFFNTGVGFSLVIVSWAVDGLKEMIT